MILSTDTVSDLAIHTLLNLIRKNGPLTQAKLCELSGYSRSTVSINSEKLLSNGLVVMDPPRMQQERKIGALSINGNLGYVAGIGLGGTICRIALFDISASIISFAQFPVNLERGPEPVVGDICTCLDKLCAENMENNKKLLGIGMGLPSPVDYEKGMAIHPAFMPGWHLFPVKQYLSERYNCFTVIDNEVNTMALGEYVEQKTDKKTLLCVKAGTGIGAGIIINGTIYRGENGGGGNMGHIQIDGETSPCSCGKAGCIEALASVPALTAKAERLAAANKESLLYPILRENNHISIQDIRASADKGDSLSLDIIREAGTVLGTLIGKMVIFLDPGSLIIAGRLTAFGPNYLDYIRRAVIKQAAPWITSGFHIEFSRLGDESAATGAALLCLEEFFEQRLILHFVSSSK